MFASIVASPLASLAVLDGYRTFSMVMQPSFAEGDSGRFPVSARIRGGPASYQFEKIAQLDHFVQLFQLAQLPSGPPVEPLRQLDWRADPVKRLPARSAALQARLPPCPKNTVSDKSPLSSKFQARIERPGPIQVSYQNQIAIRGDR